MLVKPGLGLSEEDAEFTVSSPLLRQWLARFSSQGAVVTELVINHRVMFGPRVGFAFVTATVEGQPFPVAAFLRGDSVAILVVFTHKGKEYALLVNQPRVPIGEFAWSEVPAGMLDDGGTFGGAAAKELREECGLTIRANQLVPLGPAEGIALSAGGCDERIRIFSHNLGEIDADRFQKLHGTFGHAEEGESTDTFAVPLEDLAKSADAKSLIAYALYAASRRPDAQEAN